MKVEEMVGELAKRFPRHADEITEWTDSFVRLLGDAEGERLQRAFQRTVDGWRAAYPPRPAVFYDNLPSAPLDASVVRRAALHRQIDEEARKLAQRTLEHCSAEIDARFTTTPAAAWPPQRVGQMEFQQSALFRAGVSMWVRNRAPKLLLPLIRDGAVLPLVYPFTEADWQEILRDRTARQPPTVQASSMRALPRQISKVLRPDGVDGAPERAERPTRTTGEITRNGDDAGLEFLGDGHEQGG